MIDQVSATSSSQTASTPSSTAATSNTNQLANTETFLRLLVAQLQNQDPLQPADSMQFVTQLAQFSQLEQVIAIRTDLDSATTQTSSTSTPAAGNTGGLA